jgi:hypothetical protein
MAAPTALELSCLARKYRVKSMHKWFAALARTATKPSRP